MKAICNDNYKISETDQIYTPQIVMYPEIINYNTDLVIKECGGTERIWAHVKTFKCAEVLDILMKKGIRRFKCATIGETEMCAMRKAPVILTAYPLVGPNIERFVKLITTYPESEFWAIGDNEASVRALGECAVKNGTSIKLLLDINIGMDRTGVSFQDALSLYKKFSEIPGIVMAGIHCFSGNFKITDTAKRQEAVDATIDSIIELKKSITDSGLHAEAVVLSGTPVMRCYSKIPEAFICPGTAYISDMQYYQTFLDFDFLPAAAILTRVISTPKPGIFTLDLGYKAIAADPKGVRGTILGYEDATVMFQCEEHWTWRTEKPNPPQVGDLLYVIPTHVCPSLTCYPTCLIAEHGEVTGEWEVTARNRKITI